jgi:hypothetical protein
VKQPGGPAADTAIAPHDVLGPVLGPATELGEIEIMDLTGRVIEVIVDQAAPPVLGKVTIYR